MSPSTARAVKAKLKSVIEAKVDPSTEVWRGRTNEDHQPAENVYLGPVRGEHRPVNIGQPKPNLEESYTVDVTVEVYRDGTDGDGTEERMFAIVEQVEEAVRENVRLGLPDNDGLQTVLLGRFDQSSQAAGDGWLAQETLQVVIEARI